MSQGPGHAEALLLAQQATHDERAVEALVDRLLPLVRKMVFSVMRGDQERNDVVNACMLEILRSLRRYKGEGELEAWAQRICFRVTMRQLKRLRRRQRTQVLHTEMVEDQPDPRTEEGRRHLRQRLEVHMQQLPPERRLTFYLRFVEGYSVAEVAEMTGARLNTARMRIRTALKEMRTSLEKDALVVQTLRRASRE